MAKVNSGNEMKNQAKNIDKSKELTHPPFLDIFDMLFLGAMTLHIYQAPYTKVEEIFQVNNIYDLITVYLVFMRRPIQTSYIGTFFVHLQIILLSFIIIYNHIYLMNDIPNYDFVEFPGVVYRTFISSLMIAIINFPFKIILHSMPGFTCYHMLLLSRFTLGMLNFIALKKLRNSVHEKFQDKYASNFFFLIYIAQFHTMFYISRPLPNTFALIFCNLAFAYWNKWDKTITCLALATIVFRCDIIILAFSIFIYDLFRWKLSVNKIRDMFVYGLISSLIFISLTIIIDTYFWREYFEQKLRKTPDEKFYMWPELYVLHYNTVLNKSHEWGTSPWYWYFLVAIPKSVTLALPFVGVGLFYQTRYGIIDRQILDVLAPGLIFVGLYSVLPHKELRFIFPALTLFNLAGALGLSKVSSLNNLLNLSAFGIILASFGYTALSLHVSSLNYPGGTALKFFNEDYANLRELHPELPLPYIHSDVYSSMTGFNRFLYENTELGWKYNRTENMNDTEYSVYTHLISDRNDYAGFKYYSQPIQGFSRLNVKEWIKNPLKNQLVEISDQIYILEREDVWELRQKYLSIEDEHPRKGQLEVSLIEITWGLGQHRNALTTKHIGTQKSGVSPRVL